MKRKFKLELKQKGKQELKQQEMKKKIKQELKQKTKQEMKKKSKQGLEQKSKLEPKSSKCSEPAMVAERKDVIEIEVTESDPVAGMRKWLSEYHNKRLGFHLLQQQTDEFIADFEAREEKARQEREAAATEEGWTVVAHHKGRKKTTDLESGITVGGVAIAAVEGKKKKQNTDSTVNFYRFQRREARRNEILELRQRFEEDKKKIAALRAARKFRPY